MKRYLIPDLYYDFGSPKEKSRYNRVIKYYDLLKNNRVRTRCLLVILCSPILINNKKKGAVESKKIRSQAVADFWTEPILPWLNIYWCGLEAASRVFIIGVKSLFFSCFVIRFMSEIYIKIRFPLKVWEAKMLAWALPYIADGAVQCAPTIHPMETL